MINEEKNEMILPLSNENMIRIDDFDQGDIHPDL